MPVAVNVPVVTDELESPLPPQETRMPLTQANKANEKIFFTGKSPFNFRLKKFIKWVN
jgi:hypothetical protein